MLPLFLLDKKKNELDKNISELTEKAEKEIQSFKSNSIKDLQTIANQVSGELLKELSLNDEIDQNIIIKKIEDISKKKMRELN